MSVKIGPYTFDNVFYDADADVLYLSIGDPARATDWDETPEGHAVRFDVGGDLIGLTIVGAQRQAEQAGGELIVELPARANSEDLSQVYALAS